MRTIWSRARVVSILLFAVLGGCGVWSSTIRSDVIDYSDVIETTTDQFLLINILQARDDAPLHFAALPNIHGSLQATASLAGAAPFEQGIEGSRSAAVPATATTSAIPGLPEAAFLNGSIAPAIGVGSAPSFEVDSVEAKDFVTGITSPIDPKFIKYWVDRGLDKRIILLLFFSSVEIVDTAFDPCTDSNLALIASAANAAPSHLVRQCRDKTTFGRGAAIEIRNNPRQAADQIEACERAGMPDCHSRTEFDLYLRLIDSLKEGVTANAYSQRTLLAHDREFSPRDAASIDPAKYQLEPLADGKYDLYSVSASPSFAFCLAGKFETLTGWLVQNTDEQPAAPPTAPLVPAKDRKSGSGIEAAMPARGNVCSDPVINVLPFVPHAKLPGAGAFVTPESSPGADYFPTPCVRPSLPPEEPARVRAPGRPYCELFLNYMATRDGMGYPDDHYRIMLTPRSVAEMIHYLGDIVYYQDRVRQNTDRNVPLTLGYDYSCHRTPEGAPVPGADCVERDGGVLFQLHRGADSGRIVVHYRGETWSVAEHTPADHTLDAFSIVSQLVNLNKSANDLRTTPTVQIVP